MDLTESELLELRRCRHCDCSTYPICTWFGEPCRECFCPDSFTHYDSDAQHPGLFKTQMAAPSRKRTIVHYRVLEIATSNDGDCLYDCISRALNQYLDKGVAQQTISVIDLRTFISRFQTNETYAAYKTLAASSKDYECIAKTHSLRSFKNVVEQCGKDVGAPNCLWGDENTLNFFAEAYRIRFVVFNDQGQLLQILGAPDFRHTMLLRLNQDQHYTLLQFNHQSVLQQHEWMWLKKSLHI